MEAAEFVLGAKASNLLFVRLTFTRKQKPQWEFTERLDEANTFVTTSEMEKAVHKHNLSWKVIRIRPYTNALADWHKSFAR